MNSIRFSTVGDVHHYLEEMPKFAQTGTSAVHYTLGSMEVFCKEMGNPERNLRAIHVAGTNGKGTTCQMLASVYQEAGFKTGLYTSPHLNRFNERIRINSRMISDESMLEFFQQFESEIVRIPLSYFEISTCLAFWYLDQEDVDVAVIEAGLGGRLDATNVLDAEISVITSIGLDHTDILGDTIRDIAREKGGIIKPNRPVVIGRLTPEAEEVLVERAGQVNSELIRSSEYSPETADSIFKLKDGNKTITIHRGKRKTIDVVNIATCWAVIKQMQDELRVSREDFCSGIEHVDDRFQEHAHFQQLHESLQWYFDGAHNMEAVESLLDHLDTFSNVEHPVLFFSMMKDKVRPEILRQLSAFSTVYYIEMNLPRSATCSQIKSEMPLARCISCDETKVLSILKKLKTELVIFTGSFYFYSEVKKWMASLTPSED